MLNLFPGYRFPRRLFRFLLPFVLIGVFVGYQAVEASDITYIYDELGRLVAVVDPSGDTAVYTYDAAGNLLSIARHSSTAVAIVQFSPQRGPVGSTVTIYGTGFSETTTENSVTFNGEAAVVTAATATRLVTTVPTGATSGTISVTSPGGSDTSGSSFTVSNGLAPTISGFSPTVGDPGDEVAVTGTNFETFVTNNIAAFNGVLAPVTESTETTLTATAPAQPGLGHISITTPFGTAVSTDDFFIPPAPYVAADIESTDWIEPGQSKTVSISTGGHVGALFFQGTAAQRMSIKLSGVATAGLARVFGPDGTELAFSYADTQGGLVEMASLPASGSYAIIASPADSNNQPITGDITLTLYEVPADDTDTITIGGSAVTVSTTVPGQNALLTFSGTAEQTIGLNLSSVSIPGSYIYVQAPDSSYVVAGNLIGTSGGCIENLILPVTGTYQIFVDPQIYYTGSITLQLYNAGSVTDAISIGGSPVTIETTAPGQDAVFTFSATAEDPVSLKASNVTIPGVSSVSIIGPSGATIAWDYADAIGGFIDVAALPVTGNYTIRVHPQCANVGSITLTLYASPPGDENAPTITDLDPTIGLLETAVTISGTNFETTAANNRVSFNGKLASVSTATATSIATSVPAAATSGRVSVTTSEGKAISTSDFFVPPAPYVAADVESTGRISFASGTTVTLTDANKIGMVLFDGSQGQHISLKLSGASLSAFINVISPDGTVLNYGYVTTYGDALAEVDELPATGTYTVLVVPSYSTGEVTLTLYNVPADVTGAITADGDPETVTTTVPGQNAKLTFSGTANQRVSLKTTSGTMDGDKAILILKPDGTTFAATTHYAFNSEGFIDTQVLPVSGTYTIAINPAETSPGTFTLALYTVPADDSGTITADGDPVTLTTTVPGQNGVLTFSGTFDHRVKLNISDITVEGYVYIKVTKPDGSTVEDVTTSSEYELLTDTPLPVTGTYSILLEPYEKTGSVTFTLHSIPNDIIGTITPNGPPVTVNITEPGQRARLSFYRSSNQNVTVGVTSNTIGCTTVRLAGPWETISTGTCGDDESLINVSLQFSGTYTVTIIPDENATGSITVTVTSE